MLGKKFLTPDVWETPLSHKSQMVNHIGDGARSGFDTLKQYVNK